MELKGGDCWYCKEYHIENKEFMAFLEYWLHTRGPNGPVWTDDAFNKWKDERTNGH